MATSKRLARSAKARPAPRKAPSAAFRLRMIREALADYIASEGCSCCRNEEAHTAAARRLGKLLNVKPYDDGSGYDFWRYRSVVNQS